MKRFKFLPLALFVATAFAESSIEAPVAQISNETSVVNVAANDTVLPQLSLEAQLAKAKVIAEQAEQVIIDAEEKRISKERIAKEIGNNQLQLSSTTTKVYSDNGFNPMWTNAAATKTFLREYAAFAASGVSAKSAKALKQILNAPAGSLARDILLTDSFLDYLYYNKNVVKNANNWLYNTGSYSVKAPAENHIADWRRAVRNGSAAQYMSNLVPSNHIYRETIDKLFTMSPNSSVGNANTNAKNTQKGKNTQTQSDGAVSFAKLALNAQRLRIIPSFNHGIFVNIPSYQLYYMRDGKQALQSRVIVGTNDRRTPVMISKLSNVVVNPPWYVPPTIKSKDLVPKFASNPGLIERSGYEILDGRGNKVNPSSINWSQYKGKEASFPYTIRQQPGDNAALGRYKFNMPSSDAIYLHDTPNHGLFNKTYRALSSGCVRVDKSDELAMLLLKEAGWNESKKNSVLASKKTTSSTIRSNNPVYLYYVTAWVEDGKVRTLRDVYKYDTVLPKVSIDWARVKTVI